MHRRFAVEVRKHARLLLVGVAPRPRSLKSLLLGVASLGLRFQQSRGIDLHRSADIFSEGAETAFRTVRERTLPVSLGSSRRLI